MLAPHRLLKLCFALCFCTPLLYAGGQRDPILAQADQLVKQKQFNQALRLLSDFIKEDDVRFDSAQERIRKILRSNEYYHQLVNRLIDVVDKTPDDHAAIIAIADELRRVNAPHHDSLRRFVLRLQETARFTVNRDIIEQILREGRAFIEAGDYAAAAKKYESGFVIFETELWASSFDPALLDETHDILNQLRDTVDTFVQTEAPIAAARTTITRLPAREDSPSSLSIRALHTATAQLVPRLASLVQAKTVFARAEQFFETTGALPQIEESASIGRFFYPASALFVRGRMSGSQREGLLGAADALWKSVLLPLSTAYGDRAEALYLTALGAAERANMPAAVSYINATKEFIAPLTPVLRQAEVFSALDAGYSSASNEHRQSILSISDNHFRFTAMDDALSYFAEALDIGAQFDTLKSQEQNSRIWDSWQDGRLSPEQAIRELRSIRTQYIRLNDTVQTELAAIDRNRAELKGKANTEVSGADGETSLVAALRYTEDSRRIMEALNGNVHSALITVAEHIYSVANENISKRLASLEKQYDAGHTLLTGVETTTEQGSNIIAKYSREAAGAFDRMKNNLVSGLEMGTLLLQDAEETRELGDQIQSLAAETTEYTRRLRTLEELEERDSRLAHERAGRAESLRIDGERRLSESRHALGEQNFDLARSQLETASYRWNESLDLQENPALRRAWLNEMDPLAREIARLEYEYTLKEVRGLIDTARDRYFTGVFDRAEELLIRAESRWQRVSPDPHEELLYWLGLIRAALSIRAGSHVPVTAPLYPDFSQLLSDARKYYQDGAALLRASRRQEGIAKFSKSKDKTREIKLLFPVNQDITLLELRIDQILDPAAFEQIFPQKVVAAIAGTKQKSAEAYLELENLVQIHPGFPGIQQALLEAKYDIGLLPRPADTSSVRRSQELLARAQQLFGRGDNRTQNAEIIRLANEALRENPDNRQAALFLDRVRLNAGTVATIVAADSTAEQDYLSAVREFQQGNGLIALSIIQRLLQHPANANNTRFQELRKRIETTL